MKRKILVLLVVMALLLSLVACGESNNSSNNDQSKDNNSHKTNESKNDDEAKKEVEDVTLTILHHMGEDAKNKAFATFIETVEAANPGYHYEVTKVSDPTQMEKLLHTKVAAGEPADMWFGIRTQMFDGGHAQILDDAPFMDRYSDDIIEGSKYERNGHLYFVPMDVGLQGVYYNKDIFAEYGLEVPETYEEYIAICNTLKENGISAMSLGYKDAWVVGVDFRYEMFQQLGEDPEFFKEIENGERKFTESELFLNGITKLKQRASYCDLNPFGTDNDTAVQNFAAGKAAMISTGSWSITKIRGLMPDGNFGVFALPNEAGKNTYARMYLDDAFSVSSDCKSLDAAYALFDYITSKEGANIWAQETGLIPAVEGVELKSDEEMVLDFNKIVAKGQGLFENILYIPTGQANVYITKEWAVEFLYDSKGEKSVEEWAEILQENYMAIVNQN